MKKFLIVLVLSFLLFGCGKEPKNVTINIYENGKDSKDEQIESKTNNNVDNSISDINSNNILSEDKVDDTNNSTNNNIVSSNEGSNDNSYSVPNDSSSSNNTNSNNNQTSEEDKKGWYATNKDELKDISKEILEDDVNSIKGIVSGAKDWFNKNKEGLTDAANDVYYSDKDAINELYNKFKK